MLDATAEAGALSAVPAAGNRRAQPMPAQLKFFYGPMDCGKSTLALQIDHNHARQGRHGMLLTRHDRSGGATITTRVGLARTAVERLLDHGERRRVTHLLTTCCTGFSAPGLDQDVIEQCDLPRGIERTMVGFMGCYAAINALKLARHIVRSEPDARVLILNIELCTLHFQETGDLEQMLSFLIFADGCAAALVSGDPDGIAAGEEVRIAGDPAKPETASKRPQAKPRG